MLFVARILVVDDEQDVAAMIKMMLQKDGHGVMTAGDGYEALAALGIEPLDEAKPLPDLVLLDLMLPGIDGFAVCARMLEAARTKDVPVIMLTAMAGARGPFEGLDNVAGRLDKPFDPGHLRRLIQETVEPVA
jgi:DNA-binding response OmpR family regulator